MDGLKSIGKTNNGDLEFKISSASTTAKKSTVVKPTSPLKEQKGKVGRPSTKTATVTKKTDVENISPKVKNSRKREPIVIDSSDEDEEDDVSPSKKVRTSKTTTQARSIKASGKTATTNSSIVVNNHVNEKTKKKRFNVNVDLDISFDANVIVTVKRKKKKETQEVPESPNQSIQSTDEIPPSDLSFVVKTTKTYRRAPRCSPRTK